MQCNHQSYVHQVVITQPFSCHSLESTQFNFKRNLLFLSPLSHTIPSFRSNVFFEIARGEKKTLFGAIQRQENQPIG